MNYSAYLRSLRERRDLSQDFVAQKIGVSRPTYVQIEKGKRELTLSEVEKLARLLGISLTDFLAKKEEVSPVVTIEPGEKVRKMRESDIRISVPQKHLKKFKEVLLYILEKVGAKPNIGETALYKLLYFIDFDFYEKFEKQLTGATYIKNHYGPTPVEFKRVTEQMEKQDELVKVKNQYFQYDQKKYLPRRSPNLSQLSAEEIKHIDEVLSRLADKSAKELSDYSHSDVPWQVHQPGEMISYESVFYRDMKHSVRNYDDEL